MVDVNREDVLRAWLRSQPRVLRELEAGGLAGGLAKTCVAPLERTKILFQTRRASKEMGIPGTLRFLWKTEGLPGLFRGNTASVLRIMPYAAIHFSVYEHYRRLIKEFVLGDDAQQQQQQQLTRQKGALNMGQTQDDEKEKEAREAVARVLERPISLRHSEGDQDLRQITGMSQEEKLAAVAMVVDRVMEESSASGSSIDITAAIVAAKVQLHGHDLEGTSPKRSSAAAYPAPLHPIWDLAAGSLSGATAVLITYPLDLVRTRLAYATEGALGGGGSGTTNSCSSSGSNPQSSSSCSSSGGGGGGSSNSRANFSSSSVVGLSARSVEDSSNATARGNGINSGRGSTSSLNHHHPHHSIYSMLRAAVQAEGLQGLYKGVMPTLMGILPYAGLKFYVYQSLKHAYNRYNSSASSEASSKTGRLHEGGAALQKRLPIPVMLCFGGTAGLLAQTITYPLDIVRRRMQVEGLGPLGITGGAPPSASSPPSAGAAPTVRHSSLALARAIVVEDGLRGLFRGLSVNYLKVVPSTAIGFTVYEHLKHYLDVVGNL